MHVEKETHIVLEIFLTINFIVNNIEDNYNL